MEKQAEKQTGKQKYIHLQLTEAQKDKSYKSKEASRYQNTERQINRERDKQSQINSEMDGQIKGKTKEKVLVKVSRAKHPFDLPREKLKF